MNTVIADYLVGAVIGTLLFILAVEWAPRWVAYWRCSNDAQDARIRDALAPGDFKRWEEE